MRVTTPGAVACVAAAGETSRPGVVPVSDGADGASGPLGAPLQLRCGVRLKNRLVKAAMSDSLGDGAGGPTDAQIALYGRWVTGGAALSVIGEVQVDPRYPEKPGNLVLDGSVDSRRLRRMSTLADAASAHIWPQLGHAGALSDRRVSDPVGPSPLELGGASCREITVAEIEALPGRFAGAARRAIELGFTGVEIHAAHGFLLSEFLSPLFNRRRDAFGGSIEGRSRLLLSILQRVRQAVGPHRAIGVKINATDEVEGGLGEPDALVAIEILDQCGVDVIDISGGTYFPGSPSNSDRPAEGPYYADFAVQARQVTTAALMLTGGIKTSSHAISLRENGVDLLGLARAMVLNPDLPNDWLGMGGNPTFPVFVSTPPGGVTAWYTMRLTAIARGQESSFDPSPESALNQVDFRDEGRVSGWNSRFRSSQ